LVIAQCVVGGCSDTAVPPQQAAAVDESIEEFAPPSEPALAAKATVARQADTVYPEDVRQAVTAAVERLRVLEATDEGFVTLIEHGKRKTDAHRASNELRTLPADLVVPAVIERVIESNEPIEPICMSHAYELMLEHRAAGSESGFDVLVAGLEDPYGRTACIQALGLAPESRVDRAVSALEALAERGGLDGYVLAKLFRASRVLGSMGPTTRSLAWDAFLDPAAELPPRSGAAGALVACDVDVESFERLMAQQADAEKERVLLGAFTSLLGNRRVRRLETAADVRESMQAYGLRMLDHPDAQVREQAQLGVLMFFGDQALVENAGGWRVAPALKSGLAGVAEHDPSVELREAAIQMLSFLEDLAQKREVAPR
jgi:hypothetical protein